MVALLVIVTLLALVLVDGAVQYVQTRRAQAAAPAGAPVHAASPISLSIPADYFLSPQHVWLKLRSDGTVQTGMNALIARLLGKVERVDLPEAGKEIAAGQPLFTVTSGKNSLSFLAPVTGRIQSVNRELTQEPGELAKHPFDSWVCRIAPRNLGRGLGQMHIGEDAMNWIRREWTRAQEFLFRNMQLEGSPVLGTVLPDGGSLVNGCLGNCGESVWSEFEKEFLRSRES